MTNPSPAPNQDEHKHHWRAYGQPDGTVVCDDCNIAADVNDIIDRTVAERLDEIGEPTMQDLWPDKLGSYDYMVMVINWYKDRIATVRTAAQQQKGDTK